jgi:hypothetical protein
MAGQYLRHNQAEETYHLELRIIRVDIPHSHLGRRIRHLSDGDQIIVYRVRRQIIKGRFAMIREEDLPFKA